jgi:excisionase family DNA binding protein
VPNPAGPPYTVRDLCERYGVGAGTVLAWIASREMQAINISRRPGSKKPRWRITAEALEAFELRRTANPPAPRVRRRRRPADVVEFYK